MESLWYVSRRPNVVLMEDLTSLLYFCSTSSMQHVELHCGEELPKRMGAFAFPKGSPLIEQISRVTEFLYAMRKVSLGRFNPKLIAKNPYRAVKTMEKHDRALDFQALSIFMAVFVGMNLLACVIVLIEWICWRRLPRFDRKAFGRNCCF